MRALAADLATSPATVNLAFRILRERGLIVTDGRRGTRIAQRPALLPAGRAAATLPAGVKDLSAGLPDPDLLPAVADILRGVDLGGALSLRETERIDPTLAQLAAEWLAADGVDATHLAVTSGAFDAIERLLGTRARPGDRVLVEDPTYAAFRDLLTALGLVAVPVAVDDEGPEPQAFTAALRTGVVAALVVPRAQNPTGAALSARRARELRDELARHPDVLVIEDDHAGPVAGAVYHALGVTDAWALVRSTSKALHPDLRLALVAGDATTVGRMAGRQALGPRWVSPILQALVASILGDRSYPGVTDRARDTYARRRGALIAALSERGLVAHGRSGLNVWVPVREEAATVAALRSAGYGVAAGERFRLATPPGIRVTAAVLPEDEADAVARAIAQTQRRAVQQTY